MSDRRLKLFDTLTPCISTPMMLHITWFTAVCSSKTLNTDTFITSDTILARRIVFAWSIQAVIHRCWIMFYTSINCITISLPQFLCMYHVHMVEGMCSRKCNVLGIRIDTRTDSTFESVVAQMYSPSSAWVTSEICRVLLSVGGQEEPLLMEVTVARLLLINKSRVSTSCPTCRSHVRVARP